MLIKSGDRVFWTYIHHFNSKSSVIKVKAGEYYGRIKHTIRYKGQQPLAMVLFDGNKRLSRVPIDELKRHI